MCCACFAVNSAFYVPSTFYSSGIRQKRNENYRHRALFRLDAMQMDKRLNMLKFTLGRSLRILQSLVGRFSLRIESAERVHHRFYYFTNKLAFLSLTRSVGRCFFGVVSFFDVNVLSDLCNSQYIYFYTTLLDTMFPCGIKTSKNNRHSPFATITIVIVNIVAIKSLIILQIL